MTSLPPCPPPARPRRILIIEDEYDAGDQLSKRLLESLADCFCVVIDIAYSRAEAKALLNEADRLDEPYDLVFLDYYLPDHTPVTIEDRSGKNPRFQIKPDKEFARLVIQHPGKRTVIPYTSFPDDPSLQSVLREEEARDRDSSLRAVVCKKPSNASLIHDVREILIDHAIREPMKSTAFKQALGLVMPVFKRPGAGSARFNLADFAADLTHAWTRLDQATKEEAAKYLRIDFDPHDAERPSRIRYLDNPAPNLPNGTL